MKNSQLYLLIGNMYLISSFFSRNLMICLMVIIVGAIILILSIAENHSEMCENG
jgi:hypothetical protein